MKKMNKNNNWKKLFDVSITIPTLLSLIALGFSLYTHRDSQKTTMMVSSKEYEIKETMKPVLWDMATVLVSIKNKTEGNAVRDISHEIDILKNIHERPGYTVFWCSLEDEEERRIVKEGVQQIIDLYSNGDPIDYCNMYIHTWNVLFVLNQHKDMMNGSLSECYKVLLNEFTKRRSF